MDKDGIVRIIDFGIARVAEAATVDGAIRGTPLYMSPEQAAGKPVDGRTDVWSLGVVLYEMLVGLPPFLGDSAYAVMRAVMQDQPPRLSEIRSDLPVGVEAIAVRALEKDPAKRYQSVADMGKDLSAALTSMDAPPPSNPRVRAAYIVAVALLLAATVTSVWFYQKSQQRLDAREHAVPEISRLIDEQKPLAAYRLARKTLKVLPEDKALEQRSQGLIYEAAVKATPNAIVEIKDYLSPGDAWHPLGTTPIEKANLPSGYLRWRVSAKGLREFEGAPQMRDMFGFFREFTFPLDAANEAPEGMVYIPAAKYGDYIWSLGDFGPYDLPAHFMDRFEVTNRQYQKFIDHGGYQNRAFWKLEFRGDGAPVTWDQAMRLFRDATGRPGPSTWNAGHYPEGQADYPVQGVSWYEAAAYAEFVGKSLPVLAQWFHAAPSSVAKYITEASNFSNSPAPVGKFQGIGPFGTYDMAGNVSEWCWNESGRGTRFLLGGAYNTTSVEYYEPGVQPALDRSASHGFRCVRNVKPVPKDTATERRQHIQDFSNAKPVADEVFKLYKNFYSYDHTPLNPKMEETVQDSADWRKEKVVIDAAYNKERLPVYLFLPAHAKKPYQTVVYSPTARALSVLGATSSSLADMRFIDFVIQSGRAVVYPVYKGTYERSAPPAMPDTVSGRETLFQYSKDIGRTIDYLGTRNDIDHGRIAYMGTSAGASLGVIFVAVEDRFKNAIFLDGGFFQEKMLPGSNQADFAPRLKVPTLLITGKFDWIFLGKAPMMKLLGTQPADKKAVLFNTSHDVGEKRSDLIREVTGWLDKYFGVVN